MREHNGFEELASWLQRRRILESRAEAMRRLQLSREEVAKLSRENTDRYDKIVELDVQVRAESAIRVHTEHELQKIAERVKAYQTDFTKMRIAMAQNDDQIALLQREQHRLHNTDQTAQLVEGQRSRISQLESQVADVSRNLTAANELAARANERCYEAERNLRAGDARIFDEVNKRLKPLQDELTLWQERAISCGWVELTPDRNPELEKLKAEFPEKSLPQLEAMLDTQTRMRSLELD